MKAFLASLAILVIITAAAAVGLKYVSKPVQEVYTYHNNVRL
jgi:hypothetical protein